jgi:hypothetical protein
MPDTVRSFCTSASALGLLCCLLTAGAALGSDGIPVKITNDTSNNVVVTVFDMNASPEKSALSNVTIYGFASLSIRVIPGGNGNGHIRWTATGGDASSRTCGHRDHDQLSADSIVHISANDNCGAY